MEKLGGEWSEWAKDCRRYVHDGPRSWLHRLLHKVKTSKDPVSSRLIHSSSGHSLSGIAAIIERCLARKLTGMKFLVKSTKEMLETASSVSGLGPRAQITKLDVKDFYMSGSHNDLIDDACCA
jgi:hypothetical protein